MAPKPCTCFAREPEECACGAWDEAILQDICDNMAEVLKPLPEIPDAPGQHAGTRAIESDEGDEA